MGIIVSITGLAVIGLLALDFFGISPQSKRVTETKTKDVEPEIIETEA